MGGLSDERRALKHALAVTGTVLYVVRAAPATIRIARRREVDPRRPRRSAWALVAFNALVWLVYGVLVGHPLLGAAGLLQLPCSMIVIYYALRGRASRSRAGARPRARGPSGRPWTVPNIGKVASALEH